MKRLYSLSEQESWLRSRGRWLLLLLGVIGFAGCDDFVMYEPFYPPGDPAPLAIEPTAASLKAKQTAEFSATGGAGDYAFTVFDGAGTIGSSTGVYEAPDKATDDIVEVTDAAGASVQAVVVVTVPEALSLNREKLELGLGDEFQFKASGGVPPYVYAIEDGSEGIGTIDTADGLFVATSTVEGGTALTGKVRVADDVGTIATAEVTVTEDPADVWLDPEGPVKLPESEDIVFRAYGGSSPYEFTYSPEYGDLHGVEEESAVYTPDTAAVGTDIEITATDSEGASASAFVQVTPATPTNLVADGSFGGHKEIRLTWNDNSDGEAGYRIERKDGSDGTFQELAGDLPADTTSYEDGGLSPNTGYTYRVFATADPATYDSPPSNEAFDVSNP